MRELKFRVWSDFWEKYADFGAELCMDGSVDADFEDDNGIPHHAAPYPDGTCEHNNAQ